jgi:hypothetical protein
MKFISMLFKNSIFTARRRTPTPKTRYRLTNQNATIGERLEATFFIGSVTKLYTQTRQAQKTAPFVRIRRVQSLEYLSSVVRKSEDSSVRRLYNLTLLIFGS